MTPAAWEALRALTLAVTCLLSAGGVLGWITAEWLHLRDEQAGRNQPSPVWAAEQRWGHRR